MDLATCMKKMELVGVLAFATVDSDGAPQIRNIRSHLIICPGKQYLAQ